MANCIDITTNSRELCIRFPGGASICASPPGLIAPAPDELAQLLMGQASSAMAPLTPIFDLIGALVAVKDFATAVPEMLTDPTALADAIAELVEKVTSLAAMLPPLSVPVLIVDLITVVLRYLEGTLEKLQLLLAQEERIATARTVAIESSLTELLTNVDCAEEQLDALLENIQSGAGPIGNILVVINSISSLAGLSPIEFGGMTGNLSETIDVLEALVITLTTVRDAIPV